MLVSILVVVVLIASLFGGAKEGAVRNAFSLLALLIGIPLTGLSYRLLATVLSFLPGENWENFIGFFVTMGLIILLLYLVFLVPRKFIQLTWKQGFLFRLIGGVLNLFNAALGMVVFTLLLEAYPIFGWLEGAVASSAVVTWLTANLGFVGAMLPFV